MSWIDFSHKVRRQRTGTVPALIAWLLITGFLFQPILTYLTTPILVADRTGNTIVICTLKGLQTVNLDSPQAEALANEDLCPALSLLSYAHSAQISLPPTIPTTTAHTIARIVQRPELNHNREYFHAFLTRGPPHFS